MKTGKKNMHLSSEIASDNYTRISFGEEAELMIGACYEERANNEVFFTLGEGLLAGTHDGLKSSMVVFMELVMRRHCQVEKNYQKIILKSLTVDQISTPSSNFIRGRSGIVHQTNDAFFMKTLLHCQENLVMSGTAVWSFNS